MTSCHPLNTLVFPTNKDISSVTTGQSSKARNKHGRMTTVEPSDPTGVLTAAPITSFIAKRSSSEASVAFRCQSLQSPLVWNSSRVFLYLSLPWQFWRLQTSSLKKLIYFWRCWVFAARAFLMLWRAGATLTEVCWLFISMASLALEHRLWGLWT